MAKETIVRLSDDIEGGEAVRTIQFSWQGAAFEIDLNAKNAKAFEAAIAPYMASARRLSGARRAPARKGASARPANELASIRTWAAENGHQVAARGRVPTAVVEAFRAAQSGQPGAAAPAKKASARRAAKKAPAKKASARKAATR